MGRKFSNLHFFLSRELTNNERLTIIFQSQNRSDSA